MHIVFLFIFLLVLSIGSTIGSSIRTVSVTILLGMIFAHSSAVVLLKCSMVPVGNFFDQWERSVVIQ